MNGSWWLIGGLASVLLAANTLEPFWLVPGIFFCAVAALVIGVDDTWS